MLLSQFKCITAYVIDVKSHSGTVFFDRERKILKRLYGQNTIYDFGTTKLGEPKNLLAAVKCQAAILRKMQRAKWITPILCFTSAEIDPEINPERSIEGVYVVGIRSLPQLLKQLEKQSTRS